MSYIRPAKGVLTQPTDERLQVCPAPVKIQQKQMSKTVSSSQLAIHLALCCTGQLLTLATPGNESTLPMMGSCRRKLRMTGKKSLYQITTQMRRQSIQVSKRSLVQQMRRPCLSLPKEIEESETFDEHADDRPLAEDEDHAREEADGAADLLFPREEVEGLFGAR